jgi:endonuclease/exonuclease/phosphatase family metal-dependent hydrolase
MRFIIILFLALVTALQAVGDKNQNSYKILTFNALVDFALDKWFNYHIPFWYFRRDEFLKTVGSQEADLMAFQELLPHQFSDLKEAFIDDQAIGYSYIYDACLFFSKEKFELLESGYFWLSDDQQRFWIRTYGNFFPRILVWVKLRAKYEDQVFYFMTTHLDAGSKPKSKMIEGLKTIFSNFDQDVPVIFAGDFNTDPSEPDYEAFANLGLRNDIPLNFMKSNPTYWKRTVDHIFIRGDEIRTMNYKIIPNTMDDVLISDHKGVLETFSFLSGFD